MNVVELEIPLPPLGCNPHAKGHWRTKSKATKEYRQDVFALAFSKSRIPITGPCVVTVEAYMARNPLEGMRGVPRLYRPLDTANLIQALKPAIDGCVDGKLIPGDSHKLLSWGSVKLFRTAKEHKGRSCVVLRFEEVENAA